MQRCISYLLLLALFLGNASGVSAATLTQVDYGQPFYPLSTVAAESVWNYTTYEVERTSIAKGFVGPVKFQDGLLVNDGDQTLYLRGGLAFAYPTFIDLSDPDFYTSSIDENGLAVLDHYEDLASGVGRLGAFTLDYAALYEGLRAEQPSDAAPSQAQYIESVRDMMDTFGTLGATFLQTFVDRLLSETIDDQLKNKNIVSTNAVAVSEESDQFIVVIQITFKDGSSQLWYAKDEDTLKVVPDSWIAKDGDLRGVHITKSGLIAFFRNHYYRIFNPTSGRTTDESSGGRLSWTVSEKNHLRIHEGTAAWMDPEGRLRFSGTGIGGVLGEVRENEFAFVEDQLYLRTNEANHVVNLNTGAITNNIDLLVMDEFEQIQVGLMGHRIVYRNTKTGKDLTIGYGASPMLSGRHHVYWTGVDGKLYHATIRPGIIKSNHVEAWKQPGSPVVYLVRNGWRYAIPDETTYFTWFDSWSQVKTVGREIYDVPIGGAASMNIGSLVKLKGNDRVYMVTDWRRLQHMDSEAIVVSDYGKTWASQVKQIGKPQAVHYTFGQPFSTVIHE
ncbi:hypothetical protein HY630_01285 [Candidatus Uhrbacteria bacterium]|nr:hypothetical protein [Candidatus Uhrbacteria bacterium]